MRSLAYGTRNSAGKMRSCADGMGGSSACIRNSANGSRCALLPNFLLKSDISKKRRARIIQVGYSLTVEVNLGTRPRYIMLAVLTKLSPRRQQVAHCSLPLSSLMRENFGCKG